MSIFLTPRVLKALEFAAFYHDGQQRKGRIKTPYISHPFAVGLILAQAGFSEDVIIAGIFHDLIEDTAVTQEKIAQAFGDKVAGLVADVSEDKTLPFLERKAKYLEHLESASVEATAISAADLLANRLSMLNEIEAGQTFWQNFTWGAKETFAYDKKRIVAISKRLDHPIIRELELLVSELEQIAASKSVLEK